MVDCHVSRSGRGPSYDIFFIIYLQQLRIANGISQDIGYLVNSYEIKLTMFGLENTPFLITASRAKYRVEISWFRFFDVDIDVTRKVYVQFENTYFVSFCYMNAFTCP